jgi:hypothetical protein
MSKAKALHGTIKNLIRSKAQLRRIDMHYRLLGEGLKPAL